jgi:phage recombination protein Bet
MTTALATKPATNQVAQAKPSALKLMAARLSVDPEKLHSTLKSTVFQKASDEELLALVVVSNEYGLNPFLKEIYAFPAKGGGIVPIVSVDGWNKMLIRQPDFDGIEFDFAEGENGFPVSCTATIHIKNRSHPVKITEYFDECKRNTEPWNNMPRRMLRNRTLCQASRMAFGFSGVYNDDEATSVIDVTATTMPSEPPPKMIATPSAETKVSPQAELEALVFNSGYTFDHVQRFGIESGNITNADSLTTFAEINADEAKRLLKAKTGFLTALAKVKGEVAA